MRVEQFVMVYGAGRTVRIISPFLTLTYTGTGIEGDAHGVSIGKTLPAFMEDVGHEYDKADFTAENAAAIPCGKVLGEYIVRFER